VAGGLSHPQPRGIDALVTNFYCNFGVLRELDSDQGRNLEVFEHPALIFFIKNLAHEDVYSNNHKWCPFSAIYKRMTVISFKPQVMLITTSLIFLPTDDEVKMDRKPSSFTGACSSI
jgi:hypothetical protein